MDKNLVIVVEGKNDKNRLISIFPNANIIITNGSEISNDTLLTIESLSKTNEILLCLDPDGPGEKIRKRIMEKIPTCLNVYANKKDAISKNKKKVGIEHMSKSDILNLFNNVYRPTYSGTITYNDLFALGLMDNKEKRMSLCNNLKIGYCNGKQLLKRLNMLGIDLDTVKGKIW